MKVYFPHLYKNAASKKSLTKHMKFQNAVSSNSATKLFGTHEIEGEDGIQMISVFEYMSNGDLFDLLASKEKFPERICRAYIIQLLNCLNELHKLGIFH